MGGGRYGEVLDVNMEGDMGGGRGIAIFLT